MLDLTVKQVFNCNPKIPNQTRILNDVCKGLGIKEIAEHKTPTEVGIEVEAERIEYGADMYAWQMTNDGSLKEQGKEFISVPLKDTTLVAALEELDKFILKKNPKINFSHRCSMHVHLNVTKLTMGQLYALIATYICVEALLFSKVRDDRLGNSYCWPLVDALLHKSNISPGALSEHFKYAALNPHHLRDYGTLEFRMHGGTKDKKEILDWIDTLLCLYSFVEKYNPIDIYARIASLNTESTYDMFCRDVFGDKYPQFQTLPLHRMMRNHVTAAKLFLE